MMPGPRALARQLQRAFRAGLRRGLPAGELLRQCHEIGFKSLLLVLGGMVFFGAVMMEHGASQARKVVGDLSIVGPAYFELLVREFGPTIAGVLAAVRIGAAVSAELAAMQVTEQVDALRLCAGDPDADLVLPRLLAGLIALPALLIAGTATAALVAAGTASALYGADGGAFLDPTFVDRSDLIAFALKALGYGLAIPLGASAAGLAARGGPSAVGEATTVGVVVSCMLVLSVDLAISGALLWAGLG